MVRTVHTRFTGVACLLLTACNYLGFAQNVVFTAQVNASKIGLKDQLQLTYTIQNAQNLNAFGPAGDNFKDFDVIGGPYQSQSSQMYVSGGHMVQTASFSFTYILQTFFGGNIHIKICTQYIPHIYLPCRFGL